MSRIRDIANILSGVSTDMATDAEVTSSIASHAAAADPHTGYLKESEYFSGGKNLVINGGMDIWQRGTSFTNSTSYTADRWGPHRSGFDTGCSVTRQSINGADVGGSSIYSMRVARASGNTSTATIWVTQAVESLIASRFVSQPLTLSFYARRGNNFSASSNTFTARLLAGTAEFTVGGGGGSATFFAITSNSLSTSWQRFSVTATMPSGYTSLSVEFSYAPTGTAGADDWFEITGVQLEQGSTATPFSRAGGTLQGELASCQRYYVRFGGDANYQKIGTGPARSGQIADIAVNLPVPMRVAPHTIDYSNLLLYQFDGASGFPVTSIGATVVNNNRYIGTFYVTQAGSNWTQGTIFILVPNNSTSGYVAFSAEL